MHHKRRIYGIDFSGAKDAGKRIWIAEGVIKQKELVIRKCFQAKALPGSGTGPEACLPALTDFMERQPDAAFGLDFPFGLPADLVEQQTWHEFILAFPSMYEGPDDFREKCFSRAGNRELKRTTDLAAQTPFSPYNLRIYRQSYYGISKILYPLVRENTACVLPMQQVSRRRPWILEICPASTLRSMGLYHLRYKGNTDKHRVSRHEILEKMTKSGNVIVDQPAAYRSILEDKGGDALDSVIAAFASFRAVKGAMKPYKEKKEIWKIEGYVFL